MLTEQDPMAAEARNTTETPATAEELQAKLGQLKAAATQQYSLKNYNAASELYSEAAELQDQLNGEMSLKNADLLYQYGRCLYHVAVSKSDVLGGRVAGADEPKRKKRKVAPSGPSDATTSGEGSSGLIGEVLKSGEQKLAEDVVEAVVEEKDTRKQSDATASKPFFQITGDENWTDSEGEDEDEADAEAEEEEDDFATAYEILDMARVLLSRKLEASSEHGNEGTEKQEQRQLRERLADTHDLQAEISLENERFKDAIKDTRDALTLKLQLYPEESSLIAEAHFKLSLALEFASVTSTADGDDSNAETKVAQVDETLREEAALEMEKAILSCNSRVTKEEASLASLDGPKQAELKKSIADVKDMIQDMKNRLVDLRNPATSLSGVTGPAGAPDGSNPLNGVLGAMLGESKEEQQKRIQEATATANDLSSLIKHKKKSKDEGGANGAEATNGQGKGKRKVEDAGDSASHEKKVKFDNGA